MINWTQVFLDTFIPELPKIIRDNQIEVQRYIDIIYDANKGAVIVPIQTTGNVKGATANFVTGIFDNLIVRNQFTNLYDNTTTIDLNYYNTYIGDDVSTRDASTWDSLLFSYVDVNNPYYKIVNDVSLAFTVDQLGQEFQILFDVSTTIPDSPFTIMLDPSTDAGSIEILTISAVDSSAAWIKLIAVEYDASWGTRWALKQFSGVISRSEL